MDDRMHNITAGQQNWIFEFVQWSCWDNTKMVKIFNFGQNTSILYKSFKDDYGSWITGAAQEEAFLSFHNYEFYISPEKNSLLVFFFGHAYN